MGHCIVYFSQGFTTTSILINGNPTLSRLTEVAEILGVEVSELFKPVSTQKTISGYLEFDGRIVKVDSLDAVKQFIAEIEAISENSDE